MSNCYIYRNNLTRNNICEALRAVYSICWGKNIPNALEAREVTN